MTPSTKQEAERRDFEAAASLSKYAYYSLEKFGHGQLSNLPRTYLCIKTEAAWEVWQAARATPSTPVPASDAPRGADAFGFALMQHLGPDALAGGKMTPYRAFELGWQAAQSAQQAGDALDGERLRFAMQDIDGFVNVKLDKYDYATWAATVANNDEPTPEDELNGIRALIDAAMAASAKGE